MLIDFDGPAHLGYCTNVFPAESWKETLANLKAHVEPLRARLAPGRPFGVGLRLSDAASVELAGPGKLDEFKDYLRRAGLYVFTLNGFPFGRFHETKVKERVYQPDWTRPERLAYSVRLAEILASLLDVAPEGTVGSVSTVPCTFKEFVESEAYADATAVRLAECAWEYERIADATGRSIRLALEPEPLCHLETSAEAVAFFDEKIRGVGAKTLAARRGIAPARAVEIANRRLGICYDTCHLAVEYEDAFESVARYEAAGVALAKIQVSSAIRLRPEFEALAELSRFGDAVYLHQTIARSGDASLRRWKDIGPMLESFAEEEPPVVEELRVHCHVPLYLTEHRGLASTSDFVPEVLAALRGRGLVDHFEIETYTFDVLPEELRREGIDAAMVREYRWFLDRLAESSPASPAP